MACALHAAADRVLGPGRAEAAAHRGGAPAPPPAAAPPHPAICRLAPLPAALTPTACHLAPPLATPPRRLPPLPWGRTCRTPPSIASPPSRRRLEPRLAPLPRRCAGDYARWSWRSEAWSIAAWTAAATGPWTTAATGPWSRAKRLFEVHRLRCGPGSKDRARKGEGVVEGGPASEGQ